MPLPAILGTVARFAGPALVRGIRAARMSIPGGQPGSALRLGGRRRRGSLTANEMGKIVFLAQTLGKRNPAVTLVMMKALGGKL